MKHFITITSIAILSIGTTLHAQNVGINTTTPDPSSELDVTSTNKGFLTPRMTQVERNAINNPATGLLIYQTDNTAGFYVYDGSAWTPMNNPEGVFKPGSNKISYWNMGNYGKPFLVNVDTINYTGGTTTTPESKLMFIPSKLGAIRAGAVSDKSWDIDSIGSGSAAFGFDCVAKGDYSTAMGYYNIASGDHSIAIGTNSTASGDDATAIGTANSAFGEYSTALGSFSMAYGEHATAIGYSSTASGNSATAIGHDNTASGSTSLAMGYSNTASGLLATTIGAYNTASGMYSTAIGGISNKAAGDYSTTIGSYITLSSAAEGSMYLADHSRTALQRDTRTSINRFYARFDNGYYIYTDATGNYGVTMAHQGNSWSSISDSTKKENYKAAPDFLGKIAQMKIGSWNYKGQDKTQYRHYGPYAQEFYYHFGNDGLGKIGNDTTISSADIDGVMMIAIQQLIQENKQLKADNANLKAELDQQKTATEVRLSKLEALLSDHKFVQK